MPFDIPRIILTAPNFSVPPEKENSLVLVDSERDLSKSTGEVLAEMEWQEDGVWKNPDGEDVKIIISGEDEEEAMKGEYRDHHHEPEAKKEESDVSSSEGSTMTNLRNENTNNELVDDSSTSEWDDDEFVLLKESGTAIDL